MKVVIGTSRPFHLFHLGRELAEQGFDVTVIGYMPKWKVKNYNLGKAKYISFFWYLLPLSILALQRKHTGIQMKCTYLIMPLIDRMISIFMPKCEIFIGLSGVNCKSYITAKKKYGALVICDRGSSHINSQVALTSRFDKIKFPKKYIQRELLGYEVCDYILIPSLFAFDSFIKAGIDASKIKINNYGVDLKRFNLKKKNRSAQNCIKLLYVGSWSYRKGCDILYEILGLNNSITITHIGTIDDIEFPKHERLISLGHISNENLTKHYQDHDVFMLLSREDGFGMVLLEALSCGLPVIASNNCGAPDIKRLLPKENSKLINIIMNLSATEVNKIINCVDLSDEGSSIDKNIVEYFTWKEYGRRYKSLLLEITSLEK